MEKIIVVEKGSIKEVLEYVLWTLVVKQEIEELTKVQDVRK